MSSSEPSSPAARACTSTLPSAVASTGPASTGRPSTSAVSRHSSSVCDAAADDVHDVDVAAAHALEALEHEAVLAGQRGRGSSARSRRGVAGGSWPPARHAAAIRAGHVARGEEAVVVGVEQRHVGGRGLGEPVQLVVADVAPLAAALLHAATGP